MLVVFLLVLAVLGTSFVNAIDVHVVPTAKLESSPYHRWAHEHWVWNKNTASTQVNVTQLVDDYEKYDIKFGGVNIDSTWASYYNNFQPSEEKFPDFQELVSYIHGKGKRVIMWATSMVNTDNPDWQMAVDKKFLIRNKKGEVKPMKWWKGEGGLLDYSNPEARDWWHSLMDRVLVLPNGDGIDGFKCDSTDPFILEYMAGPGGAALGYNDVPYESYPQYADYYYGDFFNHTRARRGDAGLIMSRPVDCLSDEPSRLCMDQSPKYVMTSGWVGDDDATMAGLRGCARKIIYSAWDGYANFGCDIGGYRDQAGQSLADRKEMFIRSTQFNAFLPLMENGGGGEHRPWMIDPSDKEIIPLYRDLVNQHTRLSPYLHTIGTRALLSTDSSSVIPIAVNSEDRQRKRSKRTYSTPSTYSYQLGQDILVHPPLYALGEKEAGVDVSLVEMQFPGDENTRWIDWWHPADEKLSHVGGTKHRRLVPLVEYPVYVRQGALLPLMEDGAFGLTEAHLTFTWFAPRPGKGGSVTADSLESGEVGPGTSATASFTGPSTAEVRVTAHKGAVGVTLIDVEKPVKVNVKGVPCLEHVYNPLRKTLEIKCRDNRLGEIITIEFL